MTGIKKGDRVRVTVEAEVRGISAHYLNIQRDDGLWLGEIRHDLVTVEKIEPPVEVFKRGDVVRSKNIPEYTYHILEKGYVDRFNSIYRDYSTIFTSESYERIE